MFFVLLLFTKDARKIARDVLIAAAVLAPWLIYNQLAFGHWAASFMDSYAMNMRFRTYLAGPFRLSDVAAVGLYLLPLAAMGVAMLVWTKNGRAKPGRPFWIMAVFLVLALLSYSRIQQKQTRYLFDLSLPLAYFTAAGIAKLIAPERGAWRGAAAAAGLALLSVGWTVADYNRDPDRMRLDDVRVYQRVVAELAPRLNGCRLATNAWDFVNYLGRAAEPFPMDNVIEDRVAEGYRLLLFKNLAEPKLDQSLHDRLPIMAETEAYILIGTGACLPTRRYIYRYLELRKERDLKNGRTNFPDTLFKLIFR